MVHMHRNGVRFQLGVDAVELLFENALRYDAPLTPKQVLQNRRFTTRELQRHAANAYVSTDGVEYDVPCPQRGTERRTRTAQQGLCPSDEFAHGKGFHEIVVRPGIEAKDPLLHSIARGEDQYRDMISCGTQLSEQIQPIAVGKAEIQNRGIIGGVCQRLLCVGSHAYGVYDEFGSFQCGFDELRNSWLILNDQKTHMRAF